jgi:hypothetical protein
VTMSDEASDATLVMADLAEQAGFLAAHAIWCVSDGSVLVPFVGCALPDGEDTLNRFVDEKHVERAVERAKEHLAANTENALFATLVYDGYATLAEGKTDSLVLESRVYSTPAIMMTMIVPYRNAEHHDGFAVYRPKFRGVSAPVSPDYEALAEAFFRGVDAHEKGAEVWNRHLDQSR